MINLYIIYQMLKNTDYIYNLEYTIYQMMSSFMCQDCNMEFQTGNQLANHKNKFCLNSKYGAVDKLQSNFKQASQNKDISKFGNMSLSRQGRTYDFEKNEQNTNSLEQQYKNILKQIDDEKNLKNKMQAERQKAFRELQALQKQQEQIVIDDKRNNLQDIISRRDALAREQQQLQKEIREYQAKKKQWQKSQVKTKDTVDQPYQQGLKAGKLSFQRAMLEQRKHNMQAQLNAKRREKQKIQNNLLQMSSVEDHRPISKASKALNTIKPNMSVPAVKVPDSPHLQPYEKKYNYSRLNNDRPQSQSNASQTSKMSSYLNPNALDGTQKILKFNLNKQGKSQQDKLIQTIMAQQYDDLLILSKLPKGSQLYNVKMKQYVQLSKHRMEAQEKAQKQRIQKMKRQFEFQKIITQKEKQNTEWVNDNRKAFMSKQLDILKDTREQNNNQPIPSKHSILLQPSIQNINSKSKMQMPSGMYNNQKRSKQGSIMPGVPDLNSQQNFPKQIQSYPYGQMPPRQSDRKKNKDPFGFRISILTLKNYPHKKPIKIKVILYEQFYHQKEDHMNYQFMTIYHDESNDTQDPFNPQFKNKLDANGDIAYNQSFYVPQNLQQLYNRNQKQIYLMLIAAQKDEKKITNEPRAYCWYCFKVSHFGQIKQGRFTVSLYGDDIIHPYPADMNKMKKKKQQQLIFQIQEVLLDEHMMNNAKNAQNNQGNSSNKVIPNNSSSQRLPNDSNNSGPSIENKIPNNSKNSVKTQSQMNSDQNPRNSVSQGHNKSKTNMNYPVKMKNVDQQNAINIDQDYFYSNEKQTQFTHVNLRKPLNFDVSVSGLRTLPSYIGPVKLQMSFIDSDGADVLPKQEFLAEVGTDLYNPLVNYTRKIRNQAKIPPSTIIFIRMIAISAIDYRVYSLGFTLIYLFLDRQGDPIKSNKVTDYLMTSGYYQLPIFWGNIEPQYIEIQDLLTYYPPIPCASLLIGILENASKISNPMPAYSQKVYNTILFIVDDNQAKLFKQQYKRENIDTNALISGYLQFKGIKKNYSGQQISKYLFKSLVFSSQNMKERLELKWMAEYLQSFGINFTIDKLYVPKSELSYFYFLTICISPPGSYYKKQNFDLQFIRKINLNQSTQEQFVYNDNQFFINPAYFKNSSIIIQINRVQIFQSANTQADNNIEGFAYIVIPLFELQQNLRAVNVTQAEIQLFDGDFDVNNIEKLQKNLAGFLQKNQKAKTSKATLSFRILNGYFMNQFRPVGPNKSSKTLMYRDIAPQNMSFQVALQQIDSILSNNYNMAFD